MPLVLVNAFNALVVGILCVVYSYAYSLLLLVLAVCWNTLYCVFPCVQLPLHFHAFSLLSFKVRIKFGSLILGSSSLVD